MVVSKLLTLVKASCCFSSMYRSTTPRSAALPAAARAPASPAAFLAFLAILTRSCALAPTSFQSRRRSAAESGSSFGSMPNLSRSEFISFSSKSSIQSISWRPGSVFSLKAALASLRMRMPWATLASAQRIFSSCDCFRTVSGDTFESISTTSTGLSTPWRPSKALKASFTLNGLSEGMRKLIRRLAWIVSTSPSSVTYTTFPRPISIFFTAVVFPPPRGPTTTRYDDGDSSRTWSSMRCSRPLRSTYISSSSWEMRPILQLCSSK
mmetsp:Transcript_17434/g.56559  ORF Transcript_17434/g.56559 Transcript_17434/m.56559 type:complete len:266 (-) Transcript_17434:136-933(-)